jgi:hypothetical protein
MKNSMSQTNNRRLLLLLSLVFCILAAGVQAQDNTTDEGNISDNGTFSEEGFLNLSANETPDLNSTNTTPFILENPEIFTGIIHPNEETDVKSSTPEGNPLIPAYAQGGVSVDFMGHLMEARDNDSNISSEISFHDHTDVNGYIRTLIKDFHYVSGVDVNSEE